MPLNDDDKKWIAEQLDQVASRLVALITQVKESLERETLDLKEAVDRMETRLGKIAAGSHYVTRLVEWSETQDTFQADILRRVQALERKLEGPKQ